MPITQIKLEKQATSTDNKAMETKIQMLITTESVRTWDSTASGTLSKMGQTRKQHDIGSEVKIPELLRWTCTSTIDGHRNNIATTLVVRMVCGLATSDGLHAVHGMHSTACEVKPMH